MILVGGLPGSGKSTLAGALADELDAVHLNSDTIRKERAGIPVDQLAPAAVGQGLYSPKVTRATYAAMLEQARTLLGNGESVILDASWSDASQRLLVAELAESTASDLTAFHCSAPPAVLVERVTHRLPGTAHGSDATTGVIDSMAERFAPWPEAWVIDSTRTTDECLASMRQALKRLWTRHRRTSRDAPRRVPVCRCARSAGPGHRFQGRTG